MKARTSRTRTGGLEIYETDPRGPETAHGDAEAF